MVFHLEHKIFYIFQILRLGATATDGFSNFEVPSRNVWGNVNKTTKVSKNRPNKHRDPKFSKLRASKVLKIDLPDFEFRRRAEQDMVGFSS